MAFSISNWVTNQNITWLAVGLVCFGFIGPGPLGLSPPKYLSGTSDINAVDIETKHKPDDSRVHIETFHKSALVEPAADKNGLDDSSNTTATLIPVTPKKQEKAPKKLNVRPAALKLSKATIKVETMMVSRELISHIPPSHLSLSGTAQKTSFIKTTLPLILAGNEEVERRRDAIERANQNGNRSALEKWANLYGIKVIGQDNGQLTAQLLRRADIVPVPIALAQAAVESGWGTSRFALQGNALFGQWAWSDDAGLRPLRPSNERAVVRSFGTLLGSIRAYIHNLNTHSFYQDFRDARALLRNQPNANKTKILVKFLDRYAESGPVYVSKLETLISTNNFDQFALARLN